MTAAPMTEVTEAARMTRLPSYVPPIIASETDGTTVEPITYDEAIRIDAEITHGAPAGRRWVAALMTAYRSESWRLLGGYESWGDYLTEKVPDLADLRLPPVERRELAAAYRAEGASTREIGDRLGVGQRTVVRDLAAGESDDSPAPITGRDGKTYPATRPTPATAPVEDPLVDPLTDPLPVDLEPDDEVEEAAAAPPPPTALEIVESSAEYRLGNYRSAFRRAARAIFPPISPFDIRDAAGKVTQEEIDVLDGSIAAVVDYRRRLVEAMPGGGGQVIRPPFGPRATRRVSLTRRSPNDPDRQRQLLDRIGISLGAAAIVAEEITDLSELDPAAAAAYDDDYRRSLRVLAALTTRVENARPSGARRRSLGDLDTGTEL